MASEQLTPFASALAGALGSVFANGVVYPLDTVKTRLQALPAESDSRDGSTPVPREAASKPGSGVTAMPQALLRRLKKVRLLSMLLKIIKTEGIAGAYRGFAANSLNSFSQQFAYFFFHTFLRTSLLTRLSIASLSTPQELLLGAAAGALAQIFTIPVQVIATRQQLSEGKSNDSLLSVGREIIHEGGVTALWTGLRAGLVLTVNPAITYGVFERGKTLILSRQGRAGSRLSVGEAFWLGVTSKTLATVVTYPYIFAKVRLQAKTASTPPPIDPSDPDHPSYAEVASHPPSADAALHTSESGLEEKATRTRVSGREVGAVALLARVYKEKGVRGWYQGLGAQIVKAVLCQGILFVSKDQFESYAILILALITRLRKRITLRT